MQISFLKLSLSCDFVCSRPAKDNQDTNWFLCIPRTVIVTSSSGCTVSCDVWTLSSLMKQRGFTKKLRIHRLQLAYRSSTLLLNVEPNWVGNQFVVVHAIRHQAGRGNHLSCDGNFVSFITLVILRNWYPSVRHNLALRDDLRRRWFVLSYVT